MGPSTLSSHVCLTSFQLQPQSGHGMLRSPVVASENGGFIALVVCRNSEKGSGDLSGAKVSAALLHFQQLD